MTCLWDSLKHLAESRKVFRRPSGYYDDHGRWNERTEESLEICAVIQPSSPEEMQFLPENRRGRAAITIWSEKPLQVLDVANQLQPDKIEYDGRLYEVVTRTDWWQLGKFYVSMAVRIEV